MHTNATTARAPRMDRWRRGTVHSLRSEGYPAVHIRCDHEGLVSGNVGIYKDGSWCVQHHPSGWHMAGFPRKRDAQVAVATLRAEFDLSILDRIATNVDYDSEIAWKIRQRLHSLKDEANRRARSR